VLALAAILRLLLHVGRTVVRHVEGSSVGGCASEMSGRRAIE
jgi:hypothetical protein